MAVVKLKYLRDRAKLKAHLRYITHRRVERNQTITRTLFNANGRTDKQALYALIDEAPRGTIFYKMMVNLDPKREDTRHDIDLERLTKHLIRALAGYLNRDLPFVATIHNADHTPLRHMHGIFLVDGRLTRQQFRELRRLAWTTATKEARRQRRLLDLSRQHPRIRALMKARVRTKLQMLPRREYTPAQGSLVRGVKVLSMQAGCPHCGYGQTTGIPKWRVFCPSCRKLLKSRPRLLRLTREVAR